MLHSYNLWNESSRENGCAKFLKNFHFIVDDFSLTNMVIFVTLELTDVVILKKGGGWPIMNSAFHNLKPEKQELIVNAAIKEFVRTGFDKASTNEIVKEAKISKGSLFHYFKSKKELYLYLIELASDVAEKVSEEIDWDERDIFKRIEKIGFKKLQMQRKYPKIFDFLFSLMKEESEVVRGEIEGMIHSIYEKGLGRLYENIDYSKFRKDLDVQKALEILNWTMMGFSLKAVEEIETAEKAREVYLKEWECYVDILKASFYQ